MVLGLLSYTKRLVVKGLKQAAATLKSTLNALRKKEGIAYKGESTLQTQKSLLKQD